MAKNVYTRFHVLTFINNKQATLKQKNLNNVSLYCLLSDETAINGDLEGNQFDYQKIKEIFNKIAS